MAEETKEQKRVSVKEVRSTVSTSLATAFGFVIGLLWNSVVVGGLKVAGVDPALGVYTISAWGLYVITAIILTVVLVILIIVISRWGSK
jgi:hypothetical protein